MKRSRPAEYHEGPKAAQQFDQALARVMAITKEELTKREEAYQEKRRSEKQSRRTK